jgi:hypothetical protein
LAVTITLAVEKTLFRLALVESGRVPIARLFLELPLSLEEIEVAADHLADGRTVVKNEWGEFLTYEFPELMDMTDPLIPEGCPTCGGDVPEAPTEGGVEVRATLVCDACYREVRRQAEAPEEHGAFDKLKRLFSDDEKETPAQIARAEHEIFYIGLRAGRDQFTHTTLAAQSRLPSNSLKRRLDQIAARRYIHVGLLPSGDAVGYRFPPNLNYPTSHYRRLNDKVGASKPKLNLEVESRVKKPVVAPLKIVIKDKRSRG